MASPRNMFGSSSVMAYTPPELQTISEYFAISQAIVIPSGCSTVVTSGQCGFRPDMSLPEDQVEQIMLAFENAERALKAAGVVGGWKQVYQITTYAPSTDEQWFAAIMKAKRRYMGSNRPVWTGVTVAELHAGACLEMTVYAFISPAASVEDRTSVL